MKPRLPGGVRIREPRIDPQPPQHERDDERVVRLVDLLEGEGDTDEEEPDTDPIGGTSGGEHSGTPTSGEAK